MGNDLTERWEPEKTQVSTFKSASVQDLPEMFQNVSILSLKLITFSKGLIYQEILRSKKEPGAGP